MSIAYSYIDWKGPIAPPPRKVNGGLYTGEPFAKEAKWGNVPVIPEAHVYAQNLESANPPPYGAAQIPSYTRPGNNYVEQPYHEYLDKNKYENLLCLKKQ
jgi:hypothetical protein